MMVRIRGKFLLVALLMVVAFAFQAKRATAEAVNVGIPTIGFSEFPIEISKRKGFFKE